MMLDYASRRVRQAILATTGVVVFLVFLQGCSQASAPQQAERSAEKPEVAGAEKLDAAMTPVRATRLVGAALQERIVGRTYVIDQPAHDQPSHYEFRADGSFQVSGGRGIVRGTYSVEQERICMFVISGEAPDCYSVAEAGAESLRLVDVAPRSGGMSLLVEAPTK